VPFTQKLFTEAPNETDRHAVRLYGKRNVIIVKVYPESVSWQFASPSFTADLGDPDENRGMFRVMRKLIESCGYVRYAKSYFFIKDFAF
jgi:hypothetical protein